MTITYHEPSTQGQQLRIGVIVSRFNSFITDKLLEGALGALRRCGVPTGNIEVMAVPGAFELPLVAKRCALSGRFDALICLGAVLRGATSHYEIVCNESARGICQASLETGLPIILGVLTCDTLEQALERCGAKQGNKGQEAAIAAVEMANLMKLIA